MFGINVFTSKSTIAFVGLELCIDNNHGGFLPLKNATLFQKQTNPIKCTQPISTLWLYGWKVLMFCRSYLHKYKF